MSVLSRRALITGVSATGAMLGLAGCASTPTRVADVDPAYRRTDVEYATREPRGTIVVDPLHHYLYHVAGGGQARRSRIPLGAARFGSSRVPPVHPHHDSPYRHPPP